MNRFAATSKALRKLVFSPMGFKIISISRTKILAKNFQDRVLDKVSMSKREKPQSLSMLGGNATSQDIEFLQRVRKLGTSFSLCCFSNS